jgi:hypothetical protein
MKDISFLILKIKTFSHSDQFLVSGEEGRLYSLASVKSLTSQEAGENLFNECTKL